jgi:pimeloyl-ACP methyl ester carboxylesterase
MFAETTIDAPVPLNCATGPAAGPPLLLLHGVIRRWQDFLTVMPALAARWQVHALDFHGHGRSGRRAGGYAVPDYLEDARAAVEHLFREPGVVFGHSLGALVALGLAAELPERVRAVVLEDPPSERFMANLRATPYQAQFAGMHALAGSPAPVAELTRRLAEMRLPTPDGAGPRLGDLRDAASLRFTARCLQDLDPDVFPPILEGRWLGGFSPEAVAPRVTCPVLLLHGNEMLGGMHAAADADRLTRAMPDVTRIDLPQAGHLIHLMEAPATLRLATCFLESLR